ncbi:MAG TPA: hypothetical protein GXX33_09560 [Firmicutes bacterium]|nr:hypothetical protein [Bacillota bacterium]
MGIKIGILNPDGLELCTQKAFAALRDAFAQQNIKIQPCLYTEQLPQADLFIGSYEKSPIIRDLVAKEEIPLPLNQEAIMIQELTVNNHTALWACAYDTRGLLYVLYELAARINAQSVPALYQPVCERPTFKHRSILHLLPAADLKKGLTFSPACWRSYFEMLIKNRFNSFTLALASPSPAPVFPYFFTIPEHPEVNPRHISDEVRATNIEALKALGELAVEAGLAFQVGFWNFYSGHSPLPFQGLGLDEEKVGSYYYLALKQLLFNCPEISGLEFRFQSAPLTPEFCRQTIVQAVQDHGNKISLAFYANQITADTLELLVTTGIDCALVNEGWGSKLGLSYPKDHGENDPFPAGGAGRISRVYQMPIPSQLPWGDPDYLYQLLPALIDADYDGLQLTAPTTAGEESTPFGEKLETPTHWEYERYWYQLHLCGRLAYYPQTNGAVLIRDFHRRFGEKGNDLAALYHLTGKVLPLYNTFHATTAWEPALDTGGLLPFYLRRPTADPALFADCREYVHAVLNRTELTKVAPPAVADELGRLGTEIIEKVRALQEVSLSTENRFVTEWEQTLLWAELLGRFALYHSAKIKAAIELAFFSATKDFSCLEKALAFLKEARFSWEKLPFTVRPPEQRLLLLEDEKRIETLLAEYRTRGVFLIGFDFGGLPTTVPSQEINRSVFPDYYVEEGFTFVDPRTSYDPERGYGWLNPTGLQATPAPAVRLGEHDLKLSMDAETNQPFPYGDLLCNKLVWSQTPATFQVDLSPGSYQVHLTFYDRSPHPRRHGPMQITINDQVIATDLVIAPGQRVDLRETVEVTGGKITFTFSSRPNFNWFVSALTIHPVSPLITHTPITAWERGKPLAIRATVTGVNPIGQVILNYQTENERGYHMVMMTPVTTDQFVATIPAVYLEQGELINYYITAMDSGGKTGSLGSFDYPLTVNIRNTGDYTPTIFHFPPGPEEKTLKCTVRPAREVEKVILYYKNADKKINQVTLEQENAEDQYGIAFSRLEQLPDHGTSYRFVVKFKNGEFALFPNPLMAVPYFQLKAGAD